ncbi:MAG TPA: fimbria/pilus outer membrane usher protein [Candidatus Acidoferrales bacterium]|nr:fimbria/pilus outer membrane usher protein [Candidatus Acidoferrales bacterium]
MVYKSATPQFAIQYRSSRQSTAFNVAPRVGAAKHRHVRPMHPAAHIFSPPLPRIASTGSEQRAYLSLTVNGMNMGETLAVVRKDDVLVPVADLKRSGIEKVTVRSQFIDGQPYVSLRSLAPGIAYVFDNRDLSLTLTADARYFGATVVDVGGANRPPDITYGHNSSAFLNYAFDWQNFRGVSEFSELGISSHGNLYYSGFTIGPGGKFIRGLTNATFDNPALMKRWVIGDTFADGGELGGSTFLAGVSVSRNFSLNPYFIRYPGIGISGATLTPSTAQIYVNGHLVGVQQLPPGSFSITNIPVVAGGGNTAVVVRDAFGRTQTLSNSYYYATTVLQRGLNEYNYNLGSRRTDVQTSSAHYGPTVFVGRNRVGITDWFTGGGRLEAGPGLVSFGPTASVRLGSGQIGLNAGFSAASGSRAGSAVELDYSYQNRRISYGARLASIGSNYATTTLAPGDDRATKLASAFAGFEVGPRASVTLNYSTGHMRSGSQSQNLTLAGAVRLSDRFDLVATADHIQINPGYNANQFFMALNYQVGRHTLAAVSEQGGTGGGGTGISLQENLPVGPGTGYRFQHGTGSQIHDDDLFQYQTSFGSYQAEYRQISSGGQSDVLASGGLVDAGDGIMFTRAVQDGFAVIDVAGLAGVRGYYNNQQIGRTDKRGRLLIPNLLSYYGNRVGIADTDVPLSYSVDATEKTVAPPYRGGVLVRFPVQKISAITGTMIVDGQRKATIPSFGQLRVTVNGQDLVSELGRRGQFYLENVSPGRYPAEVEYADGLCAFQLTVPDRESALTEIGAVHCSPQQIGAAH